MNRISVRCFAKINLYLNVLGKRPDGFHDIHTVFQTIDLYDKLHIQRAEKCIEFRCNSDELPKDDDNLVLQAVRLFGEATGQEQILRVVLEKRIPIAAGLGGGSSDAAAALRALNELNNKVLQQEQLLGIAAEIGSDVPFFFTGGSAVGRARGDRITPMEDLPKMNLVLLSPCIQIRAAEAYKQFDLTSGVSIGDSDDRERPGEGLPPLVPWRNDLERGIFAIHPDLRSLKQRLSDLGAAEAVMSGSGSTIVSLFSDPEVADAAAKEFHSQGITATTCGSLTRQQFEKRFVIG